VELKARRLARYNEQFLWLTRALDWIASTNPPFNKDLLRKVDELRISKRAADVLRNDNIVYVGDLVQKTVAEMVRSPGCTRSIVNEFSENLASIGLHLGMELQGWPPENIEDIARELRRRT
jgi:DNA-directed RNA polymerase subunit alpha